MSSPEERCLVLVSTHQYVIESDKRAHMSSPMSLPQDPIRSLLRKEKGLPLRTRSGDVGAEMFHTNVSGLSVTITSSPCRPLLLPSFYLFLFDVYSPFTPSRPRTVSPLVSKSSCSELNYFPVLNLLYLVPFVFILRPLSVLALPFHLFMFLSLYMWLILCFLY